MVRGLIEALLGDAGTGVLNFYEANSLWINGIIVLYGILIVLSWSNYKGLHRRLLLSVMEQLRAKPAADLNEPPAQLLRQVSIPWEGALAGARFPLVAEQTAFLPRRLSLESLQAMIPAEGLVKEAAAILVRRLAKAK